MPTFSFAYELASVDTNTETLNAGYYVALHGDVGEPTRFEIDALMDQMPRAAIALALGKSSQDTKFQINVKGGGLGCLRSNHYTWEIARGDRQPMQQHELQLAFWQYGEMRAREPVFVIPRSTLDTLLAADKALSQALAHAMRDSAPLQREVHIADEATATGLLGLGMVAPTSVAGHYVLMDIEVH